MDNYPKFLASGHNIVLKVEGQEVGAAKSITSNQDFGVEGAYVIGTIMPVENTPQKWAGNLEIDKFYIRRDIGLLTNVDTSADGVLNIGPVDIEVIEKVSNQTILIHQGCTLQTSAISIVANQYVGERATFIPLRTVRGTLGVPVLPSGL